MKAKIFVSLFLILYCFSTESYSQWRVGVGDKFKIDNCYVIIKAGPIFPIGNYIIGAEGVGLNCISGEVQWCISKYFYAGVNMSYSIFFNNQKVSANTVDMRAKLVTGFFEEERSVSPFIFASIGVLGLFPKPSELTESDEEKSCFATEFGVGARFRVSKKFSIFSELGYDIIYNKNKNMNQLPFRIGVGYYFK
jgi:hypothetical protein